MNRLKLMRSVCDRVRNDSGATAIEYALIASGIAAAIIAPVTTLGSSLQARYQAVSDRF